MNRLHVHSTHVIGEYGSIEWRTRNKRFAMEKTGDTWQELPDWPIRTPWPAEIKISLQKSPRFEATQFQFPQVARIKEKERYGDSEKWHIFSTVENTAEDPYGRQMWRVGRITDSKAGWHMDTFGNTRTPIYPSSHRSMVDTPQIEFQIGGVATDHYFQFYTFVAYEQSNVHHVIGGIEWDVVANSNEPNGHRDFKNARIYNYNPPRTLRDSTVCWSILSDAVKRFDAEFKTKTVLVDESAQ